MIQDRYREKLRSIPAPGQGNGCHAALLGVANLGVMSGHEPEKIFDDIRGAIPQGRRKVSDREIREAIHKAALEFNAPTLDFRPLRPAVIAHGPQALQRILDQAPTCHEVDIWEASPIRMDWPPEEDASYFLSTLYEPGELIFIGEATDAGILARNIRPAVEWARHFQNGGLTAPHFIINPLTGLPGPKKTEGESLRADSCIEAFRYALVEFDNIPWEDQLRFWSTAKLPLRALIDSGGKSIHGLVDVHAIIPVDTAQEWEQQVKCGLYDQFLTPMGVDSSCANPARLSRLPGHFRKEKSKYQRLLWLSHTAKMGVFHA